MQNKRIGFVGTGQMARALAAGFVDAGLCASDSILGSDPLETARASFAARVPGAQLRESNAQVVADSDVVFLAVKPQQIPQVAEAIRPSVDESRLVVSIAAGVTLDQLGHRLGTQRVIRVMPNTPCLVGRGATAFAVGSAASEADAELVSELLSAVGITFRLDEAYLDAVTGLSGSGPAFVYLLIEALSDGGVRTGLPRSVASALAAQTVLGAAEMVRATEEHPAVLKDRVASPGGTTIAGLQALEEHGMRAAVIAAVVAAADRAREMGREA